MTDGERRAQPTADAATTGHLALSSIRQAEQATESTENTSKQHSSMVSAYRFLLWVPAMASLYDGLHAVK